MLGEAWYDDGWTMIEFTDFIGDYVTIQHLGDKYIIITAEDDAVTLSRSQAADVAQLLLRFAETGTIAEVK